MVNKSFYILIAFVLGLHFSCKNETAAPQQVKDKDFSPTGNVADLVYNPVRSDASIDSSFLPIMTWQDTLFDFGSINEGDVVEHTYRFTNTGTAPLLINQATSTCGCTIPEWPKNPIPPDSTGAIVVKFNSLNKPGHQTKVVTIFANTFPNSSKVSITGNVNPKK